MASCMAAIAGASFAAWLPVLFSFQYQPYDGYEQQERDAETKAHQPFVLLIEHIHDSSPFTYRALNKNNRSSRTSDGTSNMNPAINAAISARPIAGFVTPPYTVK
jgi:hypothetical protein